MLLSFALAFTLTLGVQGMLAVQSLAEGEDTPLACIEDLTIYKYDEVDNVDVDNPLAFATSDVHGEETIETRGGSISFVAGTLWNDGSELVPDDANVTWNLAEGADDIATITPGGMLRASGDSDGTVQAIATVDGSLTADGEPLEAYVDVTVVNQSGPYVKSIAICDELGEAISPSYSFDDDDLLGTATVELGAYVTVHDPDTDEDTKYYVTAADGLADQTDGELPDIEWSTADDLYGVVDSSGVYKPLTTGPNKVFATSSAGLLGQKVSAQIVVSMPGTSSDFHPQDKLTVRVVYEKDRDTVVKEKTYDIDYLEALGTQTVTYTAKGGGGVNGYITYTGRGPYLAAILRDAGINTQGVKELTFGTADNYQDAVSWSWIVDTDRYYFPNLDVNSESEKQQVAPMIAIESAKALPDTPSSPNYDLAEQRRFLLLFGSKTGNQQTNTSHFQVYNIHTIFVVLEGSAPVEGGGDKEDGGTDDGNNNDAKEDEKSDNKDEASQSDKGKAAAASNPSGKSNSGSNASGGGSAATGVARRGDEGTSEGGRAIHSNSDVSHGQDSPNGLTAGDLTVVGPGGKWSALQAINRHPSDVATLLLDNPLAPFIPPVAAGCFFAGCVEVLIGYRRQRRMPAFALDG